MNILIIGGTGFIGKKLVRKLFSEGQSLFLLVRPQSLDRAKEQFKDLVGIEFIQGDIENTDVLSRLSTVGDVINKIDSVIHLAALYDLSASFKESYIMNIIGTQNVLGLLRKMKQLKHFHYFSTYAVNPTAKGEVSEDYLAPEDSKFTDNYGKTKNYAEHLVRTRVPQDVDLVIHRPGIIVGDSVTGERDKDDGPYHFFKFIHLLKGLSPLSQKLPYLPLPVQKRSLIPLLPVDTLVEWCAEIILHPKAGRLNCYHLVPKNEIKTKDFLELSMVLLGYPVKILSVSQFQLFSPIFQAIKMPKELVFYMNQELKISRHNLNRDFPHLTAPELKNYLPILLERFMREPL